MLKRILLTLIFSILGVFTFTSITEAVGVNMQISPVSNYFNIKAGAVQNYSLTVTNNGELPFTYQLYASAYSITDTSYNMAFDEDGHDGYNQITRWITFKNEAGNYVTNPQFTIQPGEAQVIYYRITIPDSIPDGSQYCVIFAETVKDSSHEDGSGINTISRLAYSIVGHGDGDTKNLAELTNFYITSPFTTKGISAEVGIKNSGNTDFELTYLFQVKSIFDKVLHNENSSYTVLPETERRVDLSWEDAPAMGLYKVRLAVVAGDLTYDETRLVIIMPVWMMIIIFLLLTIIIIWIIILIRKRKDNSTRLVV